MKKINLLDLSLHELETLVIGLGEKPYRARQLWQWLWAKRCRDFALMSDVSAGLRARLDELSYIAWPEVARRLDSADGTSKFLLRLEDGERIECALIPEKDHYTLCLSSQVGCALGCTFCATGQLGFQRNLSQAEILGQVLLAREFLEERKITLSLRNLVFMGMGEPLLNYDTLIKSLESLHNRHGLDYSSRRITISTVGFPKLLEQLGRTGLCSLAVSLHAPTQALREKLMPGAGKIQLEELIETLRKYPLKPRERLTFEYIMLAGINDSPAQARELVRLLSRLKAKVNLISCNPAPDSPYRAPSAATVEAFKVFLQGKGITATLRKSKGQDINAACGQLRAVS